LAVIKHISSIKANPLALLKYITGESKETPAKFITGLNCSEEPKYAYAEMGLCYESYSGHKFSKEPTGCGKQKIKMHHYVMSFKQGEITAEKAHEIGLEWAREVFGDEHQILTATHDDTDHIHIHFAVNAYSMNGEHWIDNKKNLKQCRDISDKIMREHNLSVIENPKFKHNHKYTEWLARQNQKSWKDKLCDDIDRLILQDNVNCIDDLAEELTKCGYIVKQGKYLSVKPSYLENRKAVRTLNLGDGYGLEELQYRIENKDKEMTFEKILTYSGIQREYALCLRGIQISFNRKDSFSKKVTYGELRRTADLLCFMSENNIHSKQDFEDAVNKAADESDKVIERYKAIQKRIENYENVIEKGPLYLDMLNQRPLLSKHIKVLAELRFVKDSGVHTQEDLDKFPSMLKNAKAELAAMENEYKNAVARKKELIVNYRTMLDSLETDYAKIVREQKSEFEKYQESHPKPEEKKVPFIQKVTEMVECAERVKKKAAEQERLEQQRNTNRNRNDWTR